MPEMIYILVLLLLVTLAWFFGVRHGAKSTHKRHPQSGDTPQKLANEQLAKHCFQGINYLLNEQPDQAIDVFIQSVEVNAQTLETHLALGNLMRQKGEVDRAIRVHQNLLSRPNLAPQQILQAHLELARDYLKAGLFDRAERLFLELVVDASSEYRQQALRHLVQIYRHEKEWEKAIRAASLMDKKRFGRANGELAIEQAHFCCELAERAKERGEALEVRRHLKAALKYNKNSVRANMLWANQEMAFGHYSKALKRYRMIPHQQSDYLPEILASVRHCYEELGDWDGLIKQFNHWFNSYPGSSILKALAEVIRQKEGNHQALTFLAEQLKTQPSIKGLYSFLDIHMDNLEASDDSLVNDNVLSDSRVKENLLLLLSILNSMLLNKPSYCCVQCGFKAVKLHWLCPQCESWETVKPIRGVTGE